MCPPLWLGMWVCQWMGTEQARVLMCMRVCQTSVLQEVHVCKPMRTRVMGVCAVSAWRWGSLRMHRGRGIAQECVSVHVPEGR